MKAFGIKAREHVPQDFVSRLVQEESVGGGQYLGYRQMTIRIRHKYDINVSRAAVAEAQKQHNPEAVFLRKRQRLKRRVYSVDGPNALWHYDGYDKLARFGF